MRAFKTKWLARFARRQRIEDRALVEAVERAGRGLVDADLGGVLIKQRVARPGQGRSGGHRLLIAFQDGHRAVFLYGFSKSERDNIEPNELLTLQELGTAWLDATPEQIEQALADESLKEVTNADPKAPEPSDEGAP